MFVLYPSLLFENVTVMGMITGLLSSFVGVTCLAAASIGYMFGQLKLWQRGALLAAVFLLVHTSIFTDLGGIAVISSICGIQLIKREKENKII